MKIPTLLGLALLITAITLGVMLYLHRENQNRQTKPLLAPKKIQVVNITDTSVTIVWQTDTETEGQIIFGTALNLNQTRNDNRDKNEPRNHLVHFVTLNGLSADTKYYYKIKSSAFSFPDQSLDFKTAKKIGQPENDFLKLNKPIQGTVLNTNLNPIDEALVFLKIEDASDLATFTSTAGNFIIPLTDLRSASLENYYDIGDKKQAALLIEKGDLSSEVDITLPLTQILPPITIGQNINLTNYLSSKKTPSQPKQNDLEKPENVSRFDQNSDGKVNSLDLAKVTDLYNSKQKDKKADFNGDGAIDQIDVEILSKTLGL